MWLVVKWDLIVFLQRFSWCEVSKKSREHRNHWTFYTSVTTPWVLMIHSRDWIATSSFSFLALLFEIILFSLSPSSGLLHLCLTPCLWHARRLTRYRHSVLHDSLLHGHTDLPMQVIFCILRSCVSFYLYNANFVIPYLIRYAWYCGSINGTHYIMSFHVSDYDVREVSKLSCASMNSPPTRILSWTALPLPLLHYHVFD